MLGIGKLKDAVLELAAAVAGAARTVREAEARVREHLALDARPDGRKAPPGEVIDAAPAPALESPRMNGRRVKAVPLSE